MLRTKSKLKAQPETKLYFLSIKNKTKNWLKKVNKKELKFKNRNNVYKVKCSN